LTDQDLNKLADLIASRLMAPRWMTLKQAVNYSNIGKARLIEMVRSGEIKGFQDKHIKTAPWRFDKKSIDRFMSNQVTETDNDKFAIDLLSTVDI
jgi:hypothetical protein